MCDNDQSDSGFQDLEIKVTVGSPAGSQSLLVARSGPPTLSLLLKSTVKRHEQTGGTHAESFHIRDVNGQPGPKQTLLCNSAGAGIKHRFNFFYTIV